MRERPGSAGVKSSSEISARLARVRTKRSTTGWRKGSIKSSANDGRLRSMACRNPRHGSNPSDSSNDPISCFYCILQKGRNRLWRWSLRKALDVPHRGQALRWPFDVLTFQCRSYRCHIEPVGWKRQWGNYCGLQSLDKKTLTRPKMNDW